MHFEQSHCNVFVSIHLVVDAYACCIREEQDWVKPGLLEVGLAKISSRHKIELRVVGIIAP